MTITNRFNLPETIVRAVSRHEHRGADYSATQLLKSPRHLWLERRHSEEIEEDVSDRIWALFGTAMHYIVERGEAEHQFSETYMTQEVNGVTVSGTADLYDTDLHKITDWKSTSVYSIIYGSRNEEWTQQLNIYAWLMRRTGFDVNELEIIAVLRDWSKTKSKFDKTYPQSQVVRVPIQLWSDDDAEWFVRSRVELHEGTRDTPDNDLPYCSDEYRWKSPDKFAVMKRGRKSAVNAQHTDIWSAQKQAEGLGPDHYVETRLSEARRCAEYCPVSRFCNQYQEEVTR